MFMVYGEVMREHQRGIEEGTSEDETFRLV